MPGCSDLPVPNDRWNGTENRGCREDIKIYIFLSFCLLLASQAISQFSVEIRILTKHGALQEQRIETYITFKTIHLSPEEELDFGS